MQDTMDLLWNVDRSNHQITVRIRTGTAIQIVRVHFPRLAETAPMTEWILAGCRVLEHAIAALPSDQITDLPAELTG